MKINEILECLKNSGIEYWIERNNNDEISGYSSLFQYKEGTITFIVPERRFLDFINDYNDKSIKFIIIGMNEQVYDCFENVIRVYDPRKAFFTILDGCFSSSDLYEITGITSNPDIYKKNSYISEKAIIGKNVRIGAGCVIEGDVEINDNTEIHHNVVIRNRTKIGKNCTIHSGVIRGEYGFGYTIDGEGHKHMLKHYGGVSIGNDVHIGDNSVIIRGAIDDTVIEDGVKLNTMVHIAHNDHIGSDTLITSPAHICGSVNIGKNCHIAGVTVRNQRSVGDYSTVGLGAIVVKDVPERTIVVGNPAKELKK